MSTLIVEGILTMFKLECKNTKVSNKSKIIKKRIKNKKKKKRTTRAASDIFPFNVFYLTKYSVALYREYYLYMRI